MDKTRDELDHQDMSEIYKGVMEGESMPIGCCGCARIPHLVCQVYPGQEANQHTRIGGCPMRTHNRSKVEIKEFKVNPLKASKRSQGK
jgi:hypothetical protein